MPINPKNLRFVFVKQEVHSDLYNCAHDADPATKILSSLSRVGPSGLFTLFNADFFVVRVDSAPECQRWKEVKKRIRNRERLAVKHSEFSVNVDDIDWSKYDVVICLDISIPFRITKKHRKTLWCYMPTEPSCMALYKGAIVPGYDARLNQDLGNRIQTKFGVVDFPYSFIEPGSLKRISINHSGEKNKSGVFVEPNWSASSKGLKINGLGPVRTIVPAAGNRSQDPSKPYVSAENHRIRTLNRLYASRFFFKYGGRIVRGNSIAEAMACGTIVICNPEQVLYSKLMCPNARIKKLSDAIKFAKSLKNNKEACNRMIDVQDKAMRSLLIDRPIKSLMNLLEKKRS